MVMVMAILMVMVIINANVNANVNGNGNVATPNSVDDTANHYLCLQCIAISILRSDMHFLFSILNDFILN